MATVKVGQVKKTLDKSVRYVTRPSATEGGRLISTTSAVVDPSDGTAIAAAMQETVERIAVQKTRKDGVLAHHLIQSFAPGEVDAEEAHQLGTEFARRIFGDEYEYTVATHTDTKHLHSHIIVSPVNLQTGRRMRVTKDTLSGWRRVSDKLCVEHGLSVLPPESRGRGRSLGEIYTTLRGQSGLHDLRVRIDQAVAEASTFDDFERLLGVEDIEVIKGRHTLSFKTGGVVVRDWKLGESFTQGSLMARLQRAAVNRIDVDRSLVDQETEDALVVVLPRTRGRLRITVPKEHVVWHGRTARCYVPSESGHLLSSRTGRYAGHVRSTQELYRWFSRPKQELFAASTHRRWTPVLTGELDTSQVKTWYERLVIMHQLADRMNAQIRWVKDGDIGDAATRAAAELGTLRQEFGTRLVAVTEMLDDPEERHDPAELRMIAAELRQLDARVEQVKRDVAVLRGMAGQRTMAVEVKPPAQPTREEQSEERKRANTLSERLEQRAQQISQRARKDRAEKRGQDGNYRAR